jgi:osmoprotectant transport system substrate-binding protein
VKRPGIGALFAAAAVSAALAGCGDGKSTATTVTSAATATVTLPGTGRPPVTVGDKNTYPEQFVLGALYEQALAAQGFSVSLNRNIGPTEVTMQALASGTVDVYPEYLGVWVTTIAGYQQRFVSARAAYRAGQRYAAAHGLELLRPTPFSDIDALGVTLTYAAANGLSTIRDLRKVERKLTIGGPPQFQTNPPGLKELEQTYGFVPAAFTALAVGEQYKALDQGTVQAADVNTTDGDLTSGNYVLLGDPSHVFGWGNVVPVVTRKALDSEGPAFAATINRVSSLLSTRVMRELNADVAVQHEDPAVVAKQFLEAHHLVPPGSSS